MTAQIGAVFGLLAIAADLHAQDAAPTRRPQAGHPPYRTAHLQLNTEHASILVMQKFGK